MRWKYLMVLLTAALAASAAGQAADLDRVRALVEDGEPRQALADLDEHLEGAPVDPEAIFLRGLLLAEVERQSEARAAFEAVSGLRPDRPEPLNNVAVIQAAMGDYDAAVETLKEALRTHPAYRTAYENLTKIYGQLASEAYSRALSIDQAHDRSSLELVLLSEMVLPESAAVGKGLVPLAPLPSESARAEASESDSAAVLSPEPRAVAGSAPEMETAPLDTDEVAMAAKPADEPGQPMVESEPDVMAAEASPQTPEEAIEEALRQGRDLGVPEPAVQSAESAAPTVAEPGPGPEAETSMPAAPEPAQLAVLVEAWARAWTEQRVEDYLSFYGRAFRPADDMSREAWEQLRRERLTKPRFVKVSVAFLDFEADETDRARVRFNQSYESDTFSDVVTKTLELVREDDGWKIARESVES